MPSAVLIVASTRAYADPQEILRIQDTAAALLDQGRAVDVLIPRRSPLLTAALNSGARVFTVPRIPFMDNPPRRPSVRRFFTAVLMFFRGVSLAARRNYGTLHGFDDGALIVRSIDRSTVHRYPYIAEIHQPFARPGIFHGFRRLIAQSLESSALRHAGAIVTPDAATARALGRRVPRARLLILPSPQTEIAPEDFTVGEFATAIEHLYSYVLRPSPGA